MHTCINVKICIFVYVCVDMRVYVYVLCARGSTPNWGRRGFAGVASNSGHGEARQGGSAYTSDDVMRWRAEFRFPRRQHSMAAIGYTDDELLAWREPFDLVAHNDQNCINVVSIGILFIVPPLCA